MLPPVWNKIYSFWTPGEYSAPVYDWNENTQKAASQRYQSSQSMFQIALSMVAAVWGLLFFGRDSAVNIASNWGQRSAIIASSLLLILSCYYSLSYTDMLIELHYQAEVYPNKAPYILSPVFGVLYRGQIFSLIVAALILSANVVVGNWVLKTSKETIKCD
jgi:hypothetical protein